MFLNTLPANDKYYLLNRDNLTQPIQMQLSKKQKTFSQIFSELLKSRLKFERSQKKKKVLIAYVFRKLKTAKDVITQISRKSRLRSPFKKRSGKRSQTLFKCERQHFHHIYWSLWIELTWKKSLLLTCKILALFVKTLTADDKYSLLNRDDLMQPIQMQLSKEKNSFSQCFSTFLELRLNFEHFEKKDHPHSWCISEITVSETGS